jgi:phosphoribosylformylglycinamidine cyclo-ligase
VTSDLSTPLTYADSGVSIDAGNALVRAIGPLAKATRRAGADASLGGFGGLFDLRAAGYQDPILVACTDGVGTKIKLAIEAGQHDSIGMDLVAMCVNDLIVQAAEPLLFLDYFATGKLDGSITARVVAGIAEGCSQAGCALIGGETAEMPGMYAPGDYDLAGFTIGAFERGQGLDGSAIKPGDVLLGIASSGVHSNGFSLVRKIIERSGLSLEAPAQFDPTRSLADTLLVPTTIYVKPLLTLLRGPLGPAIHGLAHITGGGLVENVPRVLPHGLEAQISADSWALPPLFVWLRDQAALPPQELTKTFNCGIGMVAVVASESADAACHELTGSGLATRIIGQISQGAPEERLCTVSGQSGTWGYAQAWSASGHAPA